MGRPLVTLDSCSNIGLNVQCDGNSFAAEPDIAGVGILNVFTAISLSACILGLWYVACQLYYYGGLGVFDCCFCVREKRRERCLREQREHRLSWFDVIEHTLISFSDQQLFTGMAYAVALYYYQGCKISAYHYDIVANMLLITLATHLAVIAVVHTYFKSLALAIPRLGLMLGVFVFTGILFANAGASLSPGFPTAVPQNNTFDPRFTWPAICFQSNSTGLDELLSSVQNSSSSATTALLHSEVNNTYIENMNLYLVAVLAYGLTGIRLVAYWIYSCVSSGKPRVWEDRGSCSKIALHIYRASQVIMLIVGFVIVTMAVSYIRRLRGYMDQTGLLIDDGVNPENRASTFGQFVPIFLVSLTVFSLFQDLNDKVKGFWNDYKTDGGTHTNPEMTRPLRSNYR